VEPATVSDEELEKFSGCLKSSGFLIYGVDNCVYTQNLLAQLGGKEIVGSMYINCTTSSKACSDKKITGYPTILINNKEMQGSRTFANFSELTGCPVPVAK